MSLFFMFFRFCSNVLVIVMSTGVVYSTFTAYTVLTKGDIEFCGFGLVLIHFYCMVGKFLFGNIYMYW